MNEDFYFEESNEEDFDLGFDHSGVDSGEDDDTYDYDEEDLKLGFVRYVGKESGDINIYELIFTNQIDEFWGEGFNYAPASLCNYLVPHDKYVTKIQKIRTVLTFNLISDCGCFSMQDCMDGIVALAYESLVGLEEYPEDGRLVLNFGDSFDYVSEKLAKKHILM